MEEEVVVAEMGVANLRVVVVEAGAFEQEGAPERGGVVPCGGRVCRVHGVLAQEHE